MRILLIGLGTRGDVQPLLGLGGGLRDAGYEVTIAAGSNFGDWIEEHGFDFAGLKTNMHEMMNSAAGQDWTEGSSNNPLRELQSMRKITAQYEHEISDDLWQVSQDTDVLVSGFTSFAFVDTIAEKLGKLHINVMLQPVTPSSHPELTLTPFVTSRKIFVNRWSGYIGMYAIWWIFKAAVNRFRDELGLVPIAFREFARRWNSVPLIYGTSPLVTPPDPAWHDRIFVTGFWFSDEQPDWQPPQPLCDFLDAGSPPIYLGFGSMSNRNPEATTRLMIDSIRQSGQRGIIYSGWAGLQSADLPEDIFLLDAAPHSWLFPRMAGVIHHGGAGTTAAGLRAGVPSTVVAHIADQPYWGRRVHELGVGAPMIRRHELTVERLKRAIEQMTSDTAMRHRAAELGKQINQETGIANAVQAFDSMLV